MKRGREVELRATFSFEDEKDFGGGFLRRRLISFASRGNLPGQSAVEVEIFVVAKDTGDEFVEGDFVSLFEIESFQEEIDLLGRHLTLNAEDGRDQMLESRPGDQPVRLVRFRCVTKLRFHIGELRTKFLFQNHLQFVQRETRGARRVFPSRRLVGL